MTRVQRELSSFIWFDAWKMFPLTCQSLAAHPSVGLQKGVVVMSSIKDFILRFLHWASLQLVDHRFSYEPAHIRRYINSRVLQGRHTTSRAYRGFGLPSNFFAVCFLSFNRYLSYVLSYRIVSESVDREH